MLIFVGKGLHNGLRVLAPLTLIYTYRRYKIFNKLFQDNEDYKTKVNRICDVLRKGFDGHSFLQQILDL